MFVSEMSHDDLERAGVQNNESGKSNLPITDLPGPTLVERPPYDEKEYKKLVHKVDRLCSTEDGQAFLWAISRPGACAHFFVYSSPSRMSPMVSSYDVMDNLKKGGRLTMNHEKAQGYEEEYLSLHVANGAGVSTAIISDTYGILGGNVQNGFVLKPEYFEKLSNFSEEELAEFRGKPGSIGEVATIDRVAKSIKNKTWTKFGNAPYEIVGADYGIRNVTLVEGELQEIPITAEDVEFFFYASDRDQLHFSFISAETGLPLAPSEISHMAQLCQDDKVRDHYLDTRNIAAEPETTDETLARLAKLKLDYPNQEERLAAVRKHIQREWEKAEGPI